MINSQFRKKVHFFLFLQEYFQYFLKDEIKYERHSDNSMYDFGRVDIRAYLSPEKPNLNANLDERSEGISNLHRKGVLSHSVNLLSFVYTFGKSI